MKFKIRFGVPEVENFWKDISTKFDKSRLNKNELKFFKKFVKALKLLEENPKHNSLSTHEIESLSKRYGIKIWQSYLENNVPSAGRIFWIYGPNKGEITIVGIEPHPEDKKRGSYDRIRLSRPSDN